ncbi:hypothetical protein [Treponema sp.]|uniref:hypothetical protein n=1 Tax=Treponema sp. TaxID=166 RepID=UPI00298E1C27|nr:hypothetical protein [Treponema sp.]MCQ2242487.1 hypothetical protein [Treponema sp.]
MDKWEYKDIEVSTIEEFNKYGEQGWEMCSEPHSFSDKLHDYKVSYSAIFKRKKNGSDNMRIIQQMFNELIAAIKALKPATQAKATPSPAQSSSKDDFKLPLEAEKERNKKELRDLFLKNAEQRSAEGR